MTAVIESPRKLDQIISAAVKLFYERGYAATDLRTIANEVNLHVSSLYNYIESKEKLLYLIIIDCIEQSTRGLDEALEGVEDPIERLRNAIRAQVLFHARNAKMAYTAAADRRLLTGDYADRVEALARVFTLRRIQLVEDGIASGRLRPVDAILATSAMLDMARGVAKWFDEECGATADELADLYADLVIRGLAVDPPSAGK